MGGKFALLVATLLVHALMVSGFHKGHDKKSKIIVIHTGGEKHGWGWGEHKVIHHHHGWGGGWGGGHSHSGWGGGGSGGWGGWSSGGGGSGGWGWGWH